MKKRFVFLLLVCSIFFGAFISNVSAMPNNIKIIRVDVGPSYKIIYSESDDDFDEVDGISFDVDTNTLTLNNHKSDYIIELSRCGEDFKIKLVGDNEINALFVGDTNINIIGNGNLTVNKDKGGYDSAIYLSQSKIVVGEDVTLKVHGATEEYFENHPDEWSSLIRVVTDEKSNEDGKDLIVFKGKSSNDEIKKKETRVTDRTYLYGFTKLNVITPKEVTIVYDKIDDEAYAMYQDPSTGKYIVVIQSICTNDENVYFLLNFTDKTITKIEDFEFFKSYDTLDELKEKYTIKDPAEVVSISHVFDMTDELELLLDSEFNKYAKDGTGTYYKLLGVSNTLTANGQTETIEKVEKIESNSEVISELTTYSYPYYYYYIDGDSLIVEPKPKEETSNPNTGDNIYIYISLLLASSFMLIKRKSLMN